MQTTKQIRKDSYEKSKENFSVQEREILHQIKCGRCDAWSISAHINMLITSVRRALNSLVKKNAIEVSGSAWNIGTERSVSKYKISERQEKLF